MNLASQDRASGYPTGGYTVSWALNEGGCSPCSSFPRRACYRFRLGTVNCPLSRNELSSPGIKGERSRLSFLGMMQPSWQKGATISETLKETSFQGSLKGSLYFESPGYEQQFLPP